MNGLRAAQVCVNRCDDDPGFHREQVDADKGDAHPGVDDYPFVENMVEYVDDAGARRATFEFGHGNGSDNVYRNAPIHLNRRCRITPIRCSAVWADFLLPEQC